MRFFLLAIALTGCGAMVDARVADGGGDTSEPAIDSGRSVPSSDAGSVSPSVDSDVDSDSPGGPPVVDSGGVCAVGNEGGLIGACAPAAELEAQIKENCKATSVASFVLLQPCGTAYSYREYSCCGADGACTPKRLDGSSSSCKDEASWRKYSESDCAMAGKSLGFFAVSVPCAGSGYKGYNFKCCKG